MHVERHSVTVTTAADGSATAYTDKPVRGAILSAHYAKTDFTDGVDFTITTEETLQNVWVQQNVNASATVAPRQATHGTDGVASLYAALGAPVQCPVYAAFERIKIVVASGGNAKTGRFTFLVGG